MRIRYLSDLHLEFDRRPGDFASRLPAPLLQAPPAASVGEGVVVLAGDIDLGCRGIEWAAKTFTGPIVTLPGNHEFYDREMVATRRKQRRTAADLSRGRAAPIHFLDRESAVVDGTRFVGCILWTDYALEGDASLNMRRAELSITDHRAIKIGEVTPKRFLPAEALREHRRDVEFLRDTLATPFDGDTVVVTHHLPSPACIAPQFAGDALNSAFASDLDWMIRTYKPSLWIFGHTHSSADLVIDETRLVCNPRGYWPFDLNPKFNPDACVDLAPRPAPGGPLTNL